MNGFQRFVSNVVGWVMMRSIAKIFQTSKTPSNTKTGFELKEIQRWVWKDQGQQVVKIEKVVVRIDSKVTLMPQQKFHLLQCLMAVKGFQAVRETRKFQIQEAPRGMTSGKETSHRASHVSSVLGWNRSLMKGQKHVT